MKIKNNFAKRMPMVLIAIFLLSSFLSVSPVPNAMAESKTEGEQGINALAMGGAWVTSYDGVGNYADLLYLPFGHNYGYSTELSPLAGVIVDTEHNSYVINWRPMLLGDSLQVCGIRVAYKLSDGAGGFESGFQYVYIPGSVLLPRDSAVEWAAGGSGGCIYLKSGDPWEIFNINLNIPDGSRIEYLRVYYYREAQVFLPMINK